MQQLPLGMRLADRAVFASFHAGENRQAVAWLQGLAAGGRGTGLLQGPAGAGKSHLLQALCAALPGSGYFPLALLRAHGPALLDGAEQLAAACIDDLHCVAGDPGWERALFRLHVELEPRGRLVLATQQPVNELPVGLADLRSRLAAAPRHLLRPLDEAGQREALKLRAQLRGLVLPEETALYLQRHYRRDMASLQGLLDTLDVESLREQRRLTVPFIRDVLRRAAP